MLGKNNHKLSFREHVLLYLLQHNTEAFSIRQLALLLKADYKNTYLAVHALKEELHFDKRSNAIYVSFNFSMTPVVYRVECYRARKFKKSMYELILQDVLLLQNPFLIVGVFGSQVKGTASKNSDIDIFIVGASKDTAVLVKKLSLLSFPLELHVFTAEEFSEMTKDFSDNVAKHIINDNIVLFGLENYYQLVRPWMKKDSLKQNKT